MYDSLEEYNEQLDKQMEGMVKYIKEQDKLFEEAPEGKSEDELLEYRYVRQPTGEIVVMSKPFFKLTPKEMRDTENNMTNEPFDPADPDVKVTKLKQPERLPPFKVDTGLEKRKSIFVLRKSAVDNMDVQGKKPRAPEEKEEIPPEEKKLPEKSMEQR